MAGGHQVPESPLALAFCCWMLSLWQEGALDFCEMAAVMGLGLGAPWPLLRRCFGGPFAGSDARNRQPGSWGWRYLCLSLAEHLLCMIHPEWAFLLQDLSPAPLPLPMTLKDLSFSWRRCCPGFSPRLGLAKHPVFLNHQNLLKRNRNKSWWGAQSKTGHFPLLGTLQDGAGAGPRCCCELLLCFLQVKLSMSLVGGDPKIQAWE